MTDEKLDMINRRRLMKSKNTGKYEVIDSTSKKEVRRRGTRLMDKDAILAPILD